MNELIMNLDENYLLSNNSDLNKDDYKNYLTEKEIDKIGYISLSKIKSADWADRKRIDGAITNEEIALYLILTDQYKDDNIIQHLKQTQQTNIKKSIQKFLNTYEKNNKLFKLESFLKSDEFVEFKTNFRKNSNKLDWLIHTNMFNVYVNKNKKDNEHYLEIEIKDLQDIKYIAFVLYKLEKKGITPQTYNSKVKKYLEYVKKGSEEFGILVNEDIPFSNPSKLYTIMDANLTKMGLDLNQRKEFYRDFNIRESSPNQKDTELKIYLDMIRDLGYKFKTLSNEEQIAAELSCKKCDELFFSRVLDDDIKEKYKNYQFSEKYYEILSKHNLEEFPYEAMDSAFEINTEYTTTDNPWEIEIRGFSKNEKQNETNSKFNIKKLNQISYSMLRYEHRSLRYPDFKYEEDKHWKEFEDDLAELYDDSYLLNP